MESTAGRDWRDTFCGRAAPLAALTQAYQDVLDGQGPRCVVVLGDRGMGKSRLVQELYRILTTDHDPDDYWPDASLFRGNNLRVAPDPASAHFSTILLTIGPLVIYAIGTAIIMPAITILVLDCFPHHRGTATSMQGFIQMLINAGVAGKAVSLLHTQRADFVIGQAVFLSLAGALWYASCRSATPTEILSTGHLW